MRLNDNRSQTSELGGQKREQVSLISKFGEMIKTVFDLEVFNISYSLAMDIFNVSRDFPKAEMYSLTDQITRSSRSISANIAEGWGKRIYEKEFRKHLIYAMGSLEETKVWLLFAKDCGYLSGETFETFDRKCDELGAKIYKLYENWKSL